MNEVKASMAGNMWKIVVKVGDHVEAGTDVAILESMKMEIPIESTGDGIVKSVAFAEGDFVQEGAVVITIG